MSTQTERFTAVEAAAWGGLSEQQLNRFLEWKKNLRVHPDYMGGTTTFPNTRLTVHHIGSMLDRYDCDEEVVAEIVEDYPYLTAEDLEFALLFVRAYPKITDEPSGVITQQVEANTASSPTAPSLVILPAPTLPKISKQPTQEEIFYPESDGKPMADNSIQFSYITALKGNFDIMYEDDPNVFISGDMLWYPVEGDNKTATAPDVMVVLGRPKHDRGSYRQWKEGNIPPQVVFEIWSPSNNKAEKDAKCAFYDRHGVEEYYAFDPKSGDLEGWVRQSGQLLVISDMQNWESPLLSVRFIVEAKTLKLHYPDGKPFLSYIELNQARKQAENLAQQETKARRTAENKAKQEAQARRIAEEKSRHSEELVRQLQEQLKKAQASE